MSGCESGRLDIVRKKGVSQVRVFCGRCCFLFIACILSGRYLETIGGDNVVCCLSSVRRPDGSQRLDLWLLFEHDFFLDAALL